jgi:hypothetical protein
VLKEQLTLRWLRRGYTEQASEPSPSGERASGPPSDGSKLRVKLLDSNFRGQPSSSPCIAPRRLVWDRERAEAERGTVVMTDRWLKRRCRARRKIAWLLESPVKLPGLFDQRDSFYKRFDIVITCKRSLLERGGKFKLGLFGSTHLRLDDIRLWTKSKDVSIVASTKQFTSGQQIRCELADAYKDELDVFGYGRELELPWKVEGLRDYRFSIAIENCFIDYYFSEKLIDCFLTGTVPIYMGPPSIARWFDTRGMIIVDGPEEIEQVLAAATPAAYDAMRPSIMKNFRLAQRFIVPEDLFVEDGLL